MILFLRHAHNYIRIKLSDMNKYIKLEGKIMISAGNAISGNHIIITKNDNLPG